MNRTILDGNVMSMYLIIMERNYGAIDSYDYSCHGYYMVKFSSSIYKLQSSFSFYGQVISSGEMLSEEIIYFQSI